MMPTTPTAPPTPGGTSAKPCKECGTIWGVVDRPGGRPTRRQGYCQTCYHRLRKAGKLILGPAWGGRSAIPHPAKIAGMRISPAMIGIRPGQPPTDPDCTPDRVWEIGNTNTRRALKWLAERGHTIEEAIALVVWAPARSGTLLTLVGRVA